MATKKTERKRTARRATTARQRGRSKGLKVVKAQGESGKVPWGRKEADELAQAREAAGLSRQELAEKVGVSASRLYEIEVSLVCRGKPTSPSRDLLERIARSLVDARKRQSPKARAA